MVTSNYQDPRSENQRIAGVRASIRMAGSDLNDELIEELRRIDRGEISADQSVLNYLESHGFSDCQRAEEIRHKLQASNPPQ